MYKEAVQLDLALKSSEFKSPLTKLAHEIPASKASISRWRQGLRKMDNDTLKRTAKFVDDWFYKYSAARADYGTLSFFKSNRLREGLFAAVVNQKQQEADRQKIQDAAFESAAVSPEKRTEQDWKNLDSFSKEFPEEIGADITELLEWCRYTDNDPKQLISQFNKQLGG